MTWPPTRSGLNSARLRGKVRPNSQATDYYFEYGLSADYGMTTATAYAGSSYDLDYVFAEVEGLLAETKYHYRVVAENDAGITVGPDRVFETARLVGLEPVLPAGDEAGAGAGAQARARIRQDGRCRR